MGCFGAFFANGLLDYMTHLPKTLAKAVSGHNRSLIIGAGPHARNIGGVLADTMDTETFVGYVPDYEESLEQETEKDIRVLGEIERFRDIIKGNKIRKISIALESASVERVKNSA